jgi:hypothetical protein
MGFIFFTVTMTHNDPQCFALLGGKQEPEKIGNIIVKTNQHIVCNGLGWIVGK